MEKILTADVAQPTFQYNFNRLFKAWGKSQGTLSKEIGVTQSRVSYWAHGMAMPTFVNLYNLAVTFGCDITEFYKEVPNGEIAEDGVV